MHLGEYILYAVIGWYLGVFLGALYNRINRDKDKKNHK